VRDLKLDLFFNLGGHLVLQQGLSERYHRESAADVERKAGMARTLAARWLTSERG